METNEDAARRVTLLLPEEAATGALPEGFAEAGWEPVGEAAALGRGAAVALSDALFWRGYRHGGLFGGLFGARYLSDARLGREVRDALRLRALGVATPRPICGRVERRGLFFELGLLSERILGETLAERILREGVGGQRATLRAAGAFVRKLHAAGFRHRDLHAGNLFLDRDGAIWLLDLEGGSWGGRPGDRAARASLLRFARHFVKHRLAGEGLPLRAALAFLEGYDGNRAARRALRAGLAGGRRYVAGG